MRVVYRLVFAVLSVSELVGSQSPSPTGEKALVSQASARPATSSTPDYIVGQVFHEKLETTLDFVATTLNDRLHGLHGGSDIVKILKEDFAALNQLKTLADNVQSKMIEIQASMDDFVTGIKRRQNLETTPLHVFRKAELEGTADSPSQEYHVADVPHTHGIKATLNLVSMTLQHSLNIFGGTAYKKLQASALAQKQLHTLTSSVKTQLQEIANGLTDLNSRHTKMERAFLSYFVVTALFIIYLSTLNLFARFEVTKEIEIISWLVVLQLLGFVAALAIK